MYLSINIVRVIKSRKLIGRVTRMEEGSSAFKILMDKTIGKKPLIRFRPRLEYSIIMDLKETG